MKEISFDNYFLPGPWVKHQNYRDRTPHYAYNPKKIADKIGSADRQVNFKGKQTIALVSTKVFNPLLRHQGRVEQVIIQQLSGLDWHIYCTVSLEDFLLISILADFFSPHHEKNN